MITTQQIADAMIRDSRGIITVPGKPSADTLTVAIPVPHVMSVAAYNKRFKVSHNGTK